MAAHLSEEFNRGFNSKDLDLYDFDNDTDRELFTFHVDSVEFTYNINQNELMKGDSLKPDDNEEWETYSPDSTWIAFAREHDLYVMRAEDADSTKSASRKMANAGTVSRPIMATQRPPNGSVPMLIGLKILKNCT